MVHHDWPPRHQLARRLPQRPHVHGSPFSCLLASPSCGGTSTWSTCEYMHAFLRLALRQRGPKQQKTLFWALVLRTKASQWRRCLTPQAGWPCRATHVPAQYQPGRNSERSSAGILPVYDATPQPACARACKSRQTRSSAGCTGYTVTPPLAPWSPPSAWSGALYADTPRPLHPVQVPT